TKPVISGHEDIVVDVFTPSIDYLNGVKAEDLYDGILNIQVDDSEVNLNKIGVYSVYLRAVDAAGNETTVTITVQVVDREAPQFRFYYPVIKYSIHEARPNFFSFIQVIDNYDGVLEASQIK